MNGDNWGTPVLVDKPGDVGKTANIAVVNGARPSSYYDGAIQRLPALRAEPAMPTPPGWGTPVNPEPSSARSTAPLVVVVNPHRPIG
ncbi:MAG: hypothetical protein IPG35_18485 [Flavobacteriales bacterium]|nr:hypothetical protein [Flavobacteriales bacterium]